MTDHDDLLDELRRRADCAHAQTPEASAPPPGIWRQMMASAQPQPETKEHPEMMIQPALATTVGTVKGKTASRPISRFVNVAASLLVVATIAFAGWFSVMNLDPGGSGNHGIAFAPGTPPAAAACDIEPLTVDEVMEIVRNPYRYLADRAESDGALQPEIYYASREESMAPPLMPSKDQYISGTHVTLTEARFDEASMAAARFLACLPEATNGLIWAMYDPTWVQMHILGGTPIFASEAEVREYVESIISERPMMNYDITDGYLLVYPGAMVVPNPNLDDASSVATIDGLYDPLVSIGLKVTDADGNIIVLTDHEGHLLEYREGGLAGRPVLVVGKSPTTGEWYLLSWLNSL